MSDVAGRIPPHDLDAEAAVLSAILLEPDAFDKVIEFLRPERFYSEANRRVFEAAAELHRKGIRIDVVTVAGELRDRERLAQVGGSAYLAMLVDAIPSVSNLVAYAQAVQTKWRVREVISTCQRVAAEGYGDIGDASTFLTEAEQSIYQAAHVDEVNDEKTIGECASVAYDQIVEAYNRGDKIIGHRTHLAPLDDILGGLRDGKLTIVAAAPGMGKSVLGQTIAINVAKHSGGLLGVQVFTPEMPDDELGERSIASEAKIDSVAFRCDLDSRAWDGILYAVSELHRYPVWVTDDADITTTKIRARVRRRQHEFNRYDEAGRPVRRIAVVIVDYLQLINTMQKKGQTREEALSNATRELKVIAKSQRVHVVAMSSLNRAIATRQDKRPMLSDLRESGAIEFHADNVVFLYRESYYDPKVALSDEVEVIVAKQRGGPTGKVKLRFNRGQSRIENPRAEDVDAPYLPHWSETEKGANPQ